MSKLTTLVGRGGTAARPHAVVHGRLNDKFVVVYKPASLPLYSDELGGDSLAKRLSDRVSFTFPVPLGREEEGLQIATRFPAVARTLERAYKAGHVRFGYSVLVTPPQCLDLAALSAQQGGTEDPAEESPQQLCSHISPDLLRPTLTLGSNTKDVGQTVRVFKAPQKPDIGGLFSDPSDPTGASHGACVGCTCRHDTLTLPVNRPLKATLHAVHDAPAPRRCVAYNVSTHGSGDEVRRMLSHHHLPVLRDFRYNAAYTPAADEHEPSGHVLLPPHETHAGAEALRERAHHLNVLHSPFAMGVGLARSALAFPDPTVRSNVTLLFDNTGSAPHEAVHEELTHLQIGVPRPPTWDAYLTGTLLDHSLHWAKQQTAVTWSRNPQADAANDAVAKRRRGDPRAERKGCVYCASTQHTVENCPKLNGKSRADVVKQQLSTMAGLQGKGDYCVLCSSRDHEVQACHRRKRGVDPKTHCAFCGSPYHTVFDCKAAHANGLGSLEAADAFAQGAGFPTYKDFSMYRDEANLAAVRGRRASYEVKQHGDAGEVVTDRHTLLPSAPALRTERDRVRVKSKRINRRTWVKHNMEGIKEHHARQRQERHAERAAFAQTHGGIDWTSAEGLD